MPKAGLLRFLVGVRTVRVAQSTVDCESGSNLLIERRNAAVMHHSLQAILIEFDQGLSGIEVERRVNKLEVSVYVYCVTER